MLKVNSQRLIFGLLCLEGAVISFNLSSIAAIVPAIAQDLQKSSFVVTRIISLYMVPYGLAALLFAPLVKQYPVKIIKMVCLTAFALSSLVAGLSHSLGLLFTSRIIAGIAASATAPIALIVIGGLAEREIRGRMVGAFFSITFVSSLTGVLLSGILPWRQLFILPAFLAAVNVLLVMRYFDFKPQAAYNFEVSYFHILKDSYIAGIFIYILVLSLVYHGIYNWLGVYFSSLRFAQMKISLLLSLVGVSGMCGQLWGGWLTDKKGRAFAATMGLCLLSLATVSLVRPFSFLYLAGLLFVFGIGWTMNHNAVSTVLTDFPDKLRPELASLNSAVRFASGGLGVSLAGIFMQRSFGFTFLGLGMIVFYLAMTTNRILRVA